MTKMDNAFQQLAHHQDTINTILANQATQTTMLKNLRADTIDIKALLQGLSKSVSELAQKLDKLAPPSPTTPLSATVASSTASTPPLPKLPTPQPTSVIFPIAAAPSPPPPLPPAKSSSSPQYPILVPMQNSVHYQSDAYYSAAALFKALGVIQNSSWHTEQKENCAHNMFVEMHKLELVWVDAANMVAEMHKLKRERKILIFDPGGDIFHAKCFFAIWSNHVGYLILNGHGNNMLNKLDECISDLEDKVGLEGVGNDTHTGAPIQDANTNARPRRIIHVPRRFLD